MAYTNLNPNIIKIGSSNNTNDINTKIYTIYYRYLYPYTSNSNSRFSYQPLIEVSGGSVVPPSPTIVDDVSSAFNSIFSKISNDPKTGAVQLNAPYYCPYEYDISTNVSPVFTLKRAYDKAGELSGAVNAAVNSISKSSITPTIQDCITKYQAIFNKAGELITLANFLIPNEFEYTPPTISEPNIESSNFKLIKGENQLTAAMQKIENMANTLLTISRNKPNFKDINNVKQPKYNATDKQVHEVFEAIINSLASAMIVFDITRNKSYDNTKYNRITDTRKYIDNQTADLYALPGSRIDSYNQVYTGTMVAGAMWTILATSLIYYVFTEI
jgi:hypothetical protein